MRRISRAGCWASLQLATRHGDTIPDPQDPNIETAYNYRYDQLGNLVHDAAAHIDAIDWTVAGKVKRVDHATGQGPDLEFAYGAGGQRISKQVGGAVMRYLWASCRSTSSATSRTTW